VIQRILRHSTVATTQNHYIKTASPDAIAAMKQFSEAFDGRQSERPANDN
jgi:integrase